MGDSASAKGKGARAASLAVADIDVIRDESLVERRRGQILDAALGLFLRKGFAATTIRDICAESGINQASLYDYVANKHDILRRLFNRMFNNPSALRVATHRADDAYPSLEAFLEEALNLAWTENRQAIQLTYRVVRDLEPADRDAVLDRDLVLMNSIADYLHRSQGVDRTDPRLTVLANMLVYCNAFVPLRQWAMRDVDRQVVLDTVVAGLAGMIRSVFPDPVPDR